MRLPHLENAYVPAPKLADYLLSETHPVGKAKARLLRAVGFDETNVDLLEKALLDIAHEEEVQDSASSVHGTKYVVDGTLSAPNGQAVPLRTVWIVEQDDDRPRFVTAYPL